jgi:hypothetical protein
MREDAKAQRRSLTSENYPFWGIFALAFLVLARILPLA